MPETLHAIHSILEVVATFLGVVFTWRALNATGERQRDLLLWAILMFVLGK